MYNRLVARILGGTSAKHQDRDLARKYESYHFFHEIPLSFPYTRSNQIIFVLFVFDAFPAGNPSSFLKARTSEGSRVNVYLRKLQLR